MLGCNVSEGDLDQCTKIDEILDLLFHEQQQQGSILIAGNKNDGKQGDRTENDRQRSSFTLDEFVCLLEISEIDVENFFTMNII